MKKKSTQRPLLTALLVGAVILGLSLWGAMLAYNLNIRNEQREIASIIKGIENNVRQTLDYSRLATRVLAHSLNEGNVPAEFDSIAADLLNSSPYIDAVQMVPGGVITNTFPLEGHESVLGYDILNTPELNTEARKAILSKQMYFAGPFNLRQGGMGILGRMPIFYGDDFWGFTAVIIMFDRLMANAGIDTTGAGGYWFQFSKVNPNSGENEYFLRGGERHERKSEVYDFTVFPEGDWKIHVFPTDRWRVLYDPIGILFLGLMLSLLSGFAVHRSLSRSEYLFKAIFEQAADGIFMADMKGRILMANPAMCELIGYDQSELKGRSLQDMLEPGHVAQKPLRTKEMSEGKTLRTERVLRTRSGALLHTEVMARKLRNGMMQGVVRDITEKRRRQAMLEEMVALRTDDLNRANLKLAEQNREVKESILYAKQLQQTVLHDSKALRDKFPYSFVIMQPRDEVSGDFHWSFENEECRILSVVDCTGHGVPGAMLTMIGVQMLNDIVKVQGVRDPGEILSRMDTSIETLLENGINTAGNDGMDAIIIRIDKATGTLAYAGAMRPLFICTNGQVTEYPGTKLSVGGHRVSEPKKFITATIPLQGSVCIYLTTDGIQSQFGGPDGRKFNKPRLRELLTQVSPLPMQDQAVKIKAEIEKWMKDEGQVDDILIVGIRADL